MGNDQGRTEDEWRALSASKSWQDRVLVATSWENLPVSLAKKYARDDIRVKVALGARPYPLPSSVISDLVNSPTPDVRESIARGTQPLTSQNTTTLLRDTNVKTIVAFASSSREIDEATSIALLTHRNIEVSRAFIESLRPIPYEYQLSLSKSPDVLIRYTLAVKHAGEKLMHEDALLILAMDEDPHVRDAARKNLDVETLEYASQHENPVIREAASAYLIKLAIGEA